MQKGGKHATHEKTPLLRGAVSWRCTVQKLATMMPGFGDGFLRAPPLMSSQDEPQDCEDHERGPNRRTDAEFSWTERWMKRRTLKRLRPGHQPELHHNVYVVLLAPAVGKIRKVRAENPKRDPKKPCAMSTTNFAKSACSRDRMANLISPKSSSAG